MAEEASQIVIRFDCATRKYGTRVAVNGLDLHVQRGELLALLGHNGAGKTTSIKMLVGLLRPSEGTVTVGPFDVVKQPREASRLVGYVPDQPFLYDKLTGREFLMFVAEMYGLTPSDARAALEREAERFELDTFLDRLTESYSHGMQQRTVFAAAMIHSPEVLVVDEPMVGLDPHSIKLVKDLLRAHVGAGNTVLMSTHTLSIAEEVADRVALMREGKLLFCGRLEELRASAHGEGQSLETLYLEMMES